MEKNGNLIFHSIQLCGKNPNWIISRGRSEISPGTQVCRSTQFEKKLLKSINYDLWTHLFDFLSPPFIR